MKPATPVDTATLQPVTPNTTKNYTNLPDLHSSICNDLIATPTGHSWNPFLLDHAIANLQAYTSNLLAATVTLVDVESIDRSVSKIPDNLLHQAYRTG